MRNFGGVLLLSGLLCLLLSAPLTGQEWVTTVVDSGADAGPGVSIAVNRASQPRIAYSFYESGPHCLKYALWDSSGWVAEAVDTAGDVWFVSLAFDRNDVPHIGYHFRDGALRYARRDTAGWFIETVDSVGSGTQYVSISINSAGCPGVAYYDETEGDLKYAEWNGNQWVIERVDTTGNVGGFASLAIDEADGPHISYYDATHRCLKYAKRDGIEWLVTAVDYPDTATGAQTGLQTSIALDSLGCPYISYRWRNSLPYGMNNGLKYARQDGSDWLVKSVVSGWSPFLDTGMGSSLALDSEDHPRISFAATSAAEPPPPHVAYVAWNGVEWDRQEIDSHVSARVTSLSLDAADHPHVAYVSGKVMYATRPTSVEEDRGSDLERAEVFSQNYPNPFRSTTTISYALPTDTQVCLSVYDGAGRLINTLVDKPQESGCYSIRWNTTDSFGRRVPSGVYFYRIEAHTGLGTHTGLGAHTGLGTEGYTATNKMIVIR